MLEKQVIIEYTNGFTPTILKRKKQEHEDKLSAFTWQPLYDGLPQDLSFHYKLGEDYITRASYSKAKRELYNIPTYTSDYADRVRLTYSRTMPKFTKLSEILKVIIADRDSEYRSDNELTQKLREQLKEALISEPKDVVMSDVTGKTTTFAPWQYVSYVDNIDNVSVEIEGYETITISQPEWTRVKDALNSLTVWTHDETGTHKVKVISYTNTVSLDSNRHSTGVMTIDGVVAPDYHFDTKEEAHRLQRSVKKTNTITAMVKEIINLTGGDTAKNALYSACEAYLK